MNSHFVVPNSHGGWDITTGGVSRNLKNQPILLRVVEAGKLCGFSRSTSYIMANTEWADFAIRIGERRIRIPYDSLQEWVGRKKQEAAKAQEFRP